MRIMLFLIFSLFSVALLHLLQIASAEDGGTFKTMTIMTCDYTTIEFLDIAEMISIRTHVNTYSLEQVNDTLECSARRQN